MTKGPKQYQPINPLWLVLVALAVVVIVSQVANAQHEVDVRQSNDMNTATGNVLGGDAIGVGFSSPSFGAAIAQCIATEASNWAFGAYGKQKVIVNYWCMGSSLYQMGRYDAAARVWCHRTDLGDLYPSRSVCMESLSEGPVEAPVVVVEGGIENSAFMDQHAETEELLAAEVEEYQMLVVDMQAKLDNLAIPVIQTVIIDDGADRRALAREARDDALKRTAE